MLTITPTAAEAVRALAADAVEDGGGIRISPGTASNDGTPLEVRMADSPEPSDQTVEEGGARVFLAPAAAAFLDDKVLDARVDAGQVRFAITETEPGPEGAG